MATGRNWKVQKDLDLLARLGKLSSEDLAQMRQDELVELICAMQPLAIDGLHRRLSEVLDETNSFQLQLIDTSLRLRDTMG